MPRHKQEITQSTQISTRLEPKDYADFKKLCHLEYSQMATITRSLVLEWLDKHRKKLK
jgi:hypothetical protein